MGAFVTMAPGAPMIAAACLAGNTALSFLKGYTTTAAIGGADMRSYPPFSGFISLLILTSITSNSGGYYCT
jgi:hypothetical protein